MFCRSRAVTTSIAPSPSAASLSASSATCIRSLRWPILTTSLTPGKRASSSLTLTVGVFAEEEIVEAIVRRGQADQHERLRRFLADGDAFPLHKGGHDRHGENDPALHLHQDHVEVGSCLERDVQGITAVVGGRRGHRQHVLDAVDLLFDRCGHGIGDGPRVGPGIGRLDRNHKRGLVTGGLDLDGGLLVVIQDLVADRFDLDGGLLVVIAIRSGTEREGDGDRGDHEQKARRPARRFVVGTSWCLPLDGGGGRVLDRL